MLIHISSNKLYSSNAHVKRTYQFFIQMKHCIFIWNKKTNFNFPRCRMLLIHVYLYKQYLFLGRFCFNVFWRTNKMVRFYCMSHSLNTEVALLQITKSKPAISKSHIEYYGFIVLVVLILGSSPNFSKSQFDFLCILINI